MTKYSNVGELINKVDGAFIVEQLQKLNETNKRIASALEKISKSA